MVLAGGTEMKRVPRGFAGGLKKVAGEFFRGVWHGMGPSPKLIVRKPRRAKGTAGVYLPRRFR